MRRDQNRDGDFNDAGEGLLYYLTDQQHSTIALLDANGDVVERYGYDAFGTPSFYDGSGTPITASAYGNDRLYTGREWLPALGLYDYRQRMYDPATGRFLTTDPAHDPANLGNPYTYVGNNPGAFVDPFGLESWRDFIGSTIFENFSYYARGRSLGGDNSGAPALNRSARAPDIVEQVVGQLEANVSAGDSRYAPTTSIEVGEAFKSTLQEAARVGLIGPSLVIGPLGVAANVANTADALTQGNVGGAILGAIPAIGALRKADEVKAIAREGIYEFTGKSGKPYVGQSGNIEKRLQQHIANDKLPASNVNTVKSYSVSGGKTAREIAEQKRLDAVGGLESTENLRNPIGPSRKTLIDRIQSDDRE